MDDCSFMNHFQMNSLEFNSLDDQFTTQQHLVTGLTAQGVTLQPSLSSNSYTTDPTLNHKISNTNATSTTTTFSGSSTEICQSFERPSKQIKTNSGSSDTTTEHVFPKASSNSSSSHIISFANSDLQPTNPQAPFCGNLDSSVKLKDEVVLSHGDMSFASLNFNGSYDKKNYAAKAGQGTKRANTMTRTPSLAHDHRMAERKRREKLTQKFIALSAIVPGLKKLDKASVLRDAMKYLKQLQERVKLLEEQAKNKSEKSVVFVSKPQLSGGDDSSSFNDNYSGCRFNESLLEIEARALENNVLVRIHCEKQKGFVAKVLSEIEKLHLSVINSSVLPFGDYSMDITVVAQMDAGFCLKPEDLVRNLRLALQTFRCHA